ncbi:MAG: dihydropteroate synthase [Robiginitomaculum sp.]|nr:MAG: dihydropteroate synthase [Robiginitomaculum sp.]
MGIVNVTPDSFSDGGQYHNAEHAISHARSLIGAGADILDIGGESTRPGAAPVSVEDELDRVMPVIEGLGRETPIPISIDTMKPAVACAAIGAGAALWNDVSALRGTSDALQTAADLNVSIVLMHMQSKPGVMQIAPIYDDVVAEVIAFLNARTDAAIKAGVKPDNIFVDPGIGFGKTLDHNLALMRALPRIRSETGRPLLFGASRKRFIEMLCPDTPADQRLGGSLASALYAAQAGAEIIRVHDVAQTVQALTVWRAIDGASS